MQVDVSIVIGIVSAVTAVISLFFAWKAVKVAERNNFAALYVELHMSLFWRYLATLVRYGYLEETFAFV